MELKVLLKKSVNEFKATMMAKHSKQRVSRSSTSKRGSIRQLTETKHFPTSILFPERLSSEMSASLEEEGTRLKAPERIPLKMPTIVRPKQYLSEEHVHQFIKEGDKSVMKTTVDLTLEGIKRFSGYNTEQLKYVRKVIECLLQVVMLGSSESLMASVFRLTDPALNIPIKEPSGREIVPSLFTNDELGFIMQEFTSHVQQLAKEAYSALADCDKRVKMLSPLLLTIASKASMLHVPKFVLSMWAQSLLHSIYGVTNVGEDTSFTAEEKVNKLPPIGEIPMYRKTKSSYSTISNSLDIQPMLIKTETGASTKVAQGHEISIQTTSVYTEKHGSVRRSVPNYGWRPGDVLLTPKRPYPPVSIEARGSEERPSGGLFSSKLATVGDAVSTFKSPSSTTVSDTTQKFLYHPDESTECSSAESMGMEVPEYPLKNFVPKIDAGKDLVEMMKRINLHSENFSRLFTRKRVEPKSVALLSPGFRVVARPSWIPCSEWARMIGRDASQAVIYDKNRALTAQAARATAMHVASPELSTQIEVGCIMKFANINRSRSLLRTLIEN